MHASVYVNWTTWDGKHICLTRISSQYALYGRYGKMLSCYDDFFWCSAAQTEFIVKIRRCLSWTSRTSPIYPLQIVIKLVNSRQSIRMFRINELSFLHQATFSNNYLILNYCQIQNVAIYSFEIPCQYQLRKLCVMPSNGLFYPKLFLSGFRRIASQWAFLCQSGRCNAKLLERYKRFYLDILHTQLYERRILAVTICAYPR